MSNANNLEIERKFLLSEAPAPEQLAAVGARRLELEQVYLGVNGGGNARVRRITEDGVVTYFHTVKANLGGIVRSEIEHQISAQEYLDYLTDADPARGPVRKTRYAFPFGGHTIELDVFASPRPGLALVEVELTDPEEYVSLPAWLEVLKDVSEDKEYANASVALEAAAKGPEI